MLKSLLPLLVLFVMVRGYAQKKEAFYDHDWKPCASKEAMYYSEVEKTDSGWLRLDYYLYSRKLQMQALYEDEKCKVRNGNAWFFYSNGEPSDISRYVHGKREGVCIRYYWNGMMQDSAFFHEGKVVDKRLRWHSNGYLSDSISRVNDSTYVHIGWFDDGSLAYAGYFRNEEKIGKWKYYHHNGIISAAELYTEGKMEVDYFDEAGIKLTDTSQANRAFTFKGGKKGFDRYLSDNIHWPRNLTLDAPGTVTVTIIFLIDENGKVRDPSVFIPFHKAFDEIALAAFQNSPAWIPAIDHNRKVKTWVIQPIGFSRSD